jgi:hypothetical protein
MTLRSINSEGARGTLEAEVHDGRHSRFSLSWRSRRLCTLVLCVALTTIRSEATEAFILEGTC